MKHERLFKQINNALLDMQAATSQTFEQHFKRFARLLREPSLRGVNERLVSGLNVDEFLSESSESLGSFHGSARLNWPAQLEEELGLKWLVIQKLADEPSHILTFAHTYYTVGTNLTRELHSLTRQLLIPFARDYVDFVSSVENESSSSGTNGITEQSAASASTGNVTYIMSGNNVRVYNQSTDNSVNSLSINGVVNNQLQALRDEILRAELTNDEKTDAIEVVDEIQAQIETGRPKPAILTALISSLPAVDAITSIAANVLEAVKSAVSA